MEHFAGCDRCRRILSQTMRLNSEADAHAASVVSAPVFEPVVPWYQTLFKTRNLALAMGGLVLTFGGILGLVVLQNRNAPVNMSQENPAAAKPAAPALTGESANAADVAVAQTSNSNAAATLTPPSTNTSGTNTQIAGEPSVDKSTMLGGVTADADSTAGASPDAGLIAMAKERPKDQPAPVTAAPPPPPAAKSITLDGVAAETVEKKADDDKNLKTESELRELASARRKQSEAPRGRDLPAAPSKSGPARAGPLNTTQSNQTQNQAFDMPVTRIVSGKSFNNRNGVWYDSAYRNQATINHRRGTSEYKKLDGGLRKIADNLGGTVVLMWKDKAYRID